MINTLLGPCIDSFRGFAF